MLNFIKFLYISINYLYLLESQWHQPVMGWDKFCLHLGGRPDWRRPDRYL